MSVLHGACAGEMPLLGRSLAKGRGDSDSQGSSRKVCAGTQQSRSSPCITSVQRGDTHQCTPLSDTDEKGMLLVILICLWFRASPSGRGAVIKKLWKKTSTFLNKTALRMLIRLICEAKHPQGTIPHL